MRRQALRTIARRSWRHPKESQMQSRKLIPTRSAAWLLVLLAIAGIAGGAVVGAGGRYPSPYVDDWSDVDLRGTGVDAGPSIQACLEASGHAIFGEGTYTVDPNGTQGFTMPDGSTIEGAGMGLTVLQMPDNETGAITLLGDDCTVRTLTFDGFDDATTLGARCASGKHRATYDRVEFKDFSTGSIDGAEAVNGVKWLGCKFTSNVTGLAASYASTGVVIQAGTFSGNTTALQLPGGPIGGSIRDCQFVSETTAISLGAASFFDIAGNSVLSATTPISLGTATNCTFGANATTNNWPALVTGTRNFVQGRLFGNAAPSTGTWQTGDFVWDVSPTSGDPAFYQCSAGGSPGTWVDGPDVP